MKKTNIVHFSLVQALDDERKRQGLTKEQLAEKSGMLSTTTRRLFTSRDSDVKLSTLTKLASALGATIDLKKVDDGLGTTQGWCLIDRIRRMRLAERLAKKTNLDPGDIEHSLYNLTLTTSERLTRRLHRG